MKKIKNLFKKGLVVLLLVIIVFSGYVAIATSNTKHMTIRQRVLKVIYPAFTWWNKLTGSRAVSFTNETGLLPNESIHDLTIELNNGENISLSKFKGKKLMLVNTASDCGFTDQYSELQKLFDENKDQLTIIAFPANDFKQQEKKSDDEIAQFCKLNYGISFPLVKKSTVKPGPEQHPVFQWLTDKTKNGWTSKKPSWNFSKYLVNEEGVLINYFDPAVSPLSKEVISAIKN